MPPGVPATWHLPDVSLPRLLADAVKDFPDTLALVERRGTQLTHVEFAGVVDRLAIGLRERRVRRVVLADAAPVAAVLVAHAAWRLGVPLVVGHGLVADDEVDGPAGHDGPRDGPPGHDGPVGGSERRTISRVVPDWDPDGDLAVGSRRRLTDLGVPAGAMVIDDLERLGATAEGRLATLAGVVGRGRRALRRLRGRDMSSLTGLVEHTTQGVLAPVSPDSVAVLHVATSGRHSFTHRALVAAVFQVRLWIPDMAAGTERVGVAMRLDDPVALVLGPVLASLTAATLRCERDPAATIAGATIAFGPVAVWHDVARRSTRRRHPSLVRSDGSPSSLRIGGVVTSSPRALLPAPEVRVIVAHTEGARLRHFWVAPAAAGPVAAQPVYGRVLGSPGAEAVTDTEITVVDGRTLASGPQFGSRPGTRHWHDVHAHVPVPANAAPRKDAP